MGERRGAYRVLVGRSRERDHFEGLEINGRIILKWVFKKWDRRQGLDSSAWERDIWRHLFNHVKKLRPS
jgi:hypothetical protein